MHGGGVASPTDQRAWSSWNYVEPVGRQKDRIDLTYWMNSLQPIPMDDPMFVTLNSNAPIRGELVYDAVSFRHPVYDLAAERGRTAIRAMNGQRGTWFSGAWMRNGFHEDGFASAIDVVQAMRAPARLAAE